MTCTDGRERLGKVAAAGPVGSGLGAAVSMRRQSRTAVSARTATPMLLCVCVNSNRAAGSWTSCTMVAPSPSAARTTAALAQWRSLSESGQPDALSSIGQRARLDRDLQRVVDDRDAKDHAEIRPPDCARCYQSDASVGSRVGIDPDGERDWLAHA